MVGAPERDLCRVREGADTEAAAAMLLGAFFGSYSGEGTAPTRDKGFVSEVVGTLMRGLPSADCVAG